VLLAQPVGVAAKAGQGVAQREQKTGHQHQIGMADGAQRQLGMQGLAAQGGHGPPSSEAV
jgi:hypothetical protein